MNSQMMRAKLQDSNHFEFSIEVIATNMKIPSLFESEGEEVVGKSVLQEKADRNDQNPPDLVGPDG